MTQTGTSFGVIEEITNRDETMHSSSRDADGFHTSYELVRHGDYPHNNNAGAYYQNRYSSYENAGQASDFINNTTIRTTNVQETNDYLGSLTTDIYRVSSPQIIREVTVGGPVTNEQRILVRYLQPPEVPPPGPLIIREERPPQSPPPPPLVIHERPPPPPSPPPLYLRERPPTPPSPIPSETIVRHLPPIPVPPQSILIKRYPPVPEKPRDIIIERWIPYGSQPERQTITRAAPPAIKYPEPYYKIIQYEAADARITRRFEKLGVVRENPVYYRTRYGSSLLDSETLVQQARNAGVFEDITPPAASSSRYSNIRDSTTGFYRSNEFINRDYGDNQDYRGYQDYQGLQDYRGHQSYLGHQGRQGYRGHQDYREYRYE